MYRCSRTLLLIVLTLCLTPVCQGQATEKSAVDRDDPRFEGIDSFFESIDDAFGTDPEAVMDLVSHEHLLARAEELGLKDARQIPEGKAADEFVDALGQAAEVWFSSFTSDQHDILKLKFDGDNRAKVYVRHWDDGNEIYAKYHWWLVRTDDGWHAYDVKDVEYDLQAAVVLVSIGQAAGDNQSWVGDLSDLVAAYLDALMTDDEEVSLEAIQGEVDTLLEQKIPDNLRAWALSLRINWLLEQEDGADDILDCVEEIESLDGDYPAVHYLRGHALITKEDYAEAIVSFQKYANRFGWDADICEYMADTHFWMDDLPKSVEYAEKGLADNANSWGCLASLMVALPADQKSKLDRHLDNLHNEEFLLEYLIDWSIDLEDFDSARHVYQVLVKEHPGSELIAHYQEILDQ